MFLPSFFKVFDFFGKFLFHILVPDFSDLRRYMGQVGRYNGIFDKRCVFRKKGGENDEQHGSDEQPFDQTKDPAADSIGPTQKGDAHQVFDDHSQNADDQKNPDKNDEEADQPVIGENGNPLG